MKTELMRGNTPRAMAEAIKILESGGILAFPTETVYGLAADAKNPDAVAKVFAAKGRPANNPLIVHCLDLKMARDCVKGWNSSYDRLAEAFWPGPLTLVLEKADDIPDIVTAGGKTVAVRVPSHVVARALLAHYERPLAAPSANRSTQISPTRAEHVQKSLDGEIPLILDGGACTVGLESTVLDLTADQACILRLGTITKEQIEETLGQVVSQKGFDEQKPRSPGMMRRHYAPSKPVYLFDALSELPNTKIAVLRRYDATPDPTHDHSTRTLPNEPSDYARELYDALHWADAQAVKAIYVENPPAGKPWDAVRDRLSRTLETG